MINKLSKKRGNAKCFTLDEIKTMLEGISQEEQPFWGITSQYWQSGQIVLFKEERSIKPKENKAE